MKGAEKRVKKHGGIVASDKAERELMRQMYRIARYVNQLYPEAEPVEVDHIVPIRKGGNHTLDNLQFLPKIENRCKQQ